MERLADHRLDPPEAPTTFECGTCRLETDSREMQFCGECGCPVCWDCYSAEPIPSEIYGLCEDCRQDLLCEEMEAEA